MTYLFWISLLLLLYVYQGYLWVLRLLPSERPGTQDIAAVLPNTTVLLTVFNEEAEVAGRIANLLALDFPHDKLQILVASDGSTDGTDAIVAAIADSRVQLFRPEVALGKTDTQNQALALATGDILVFTDAATRFEPEFLRALLAPFANARVGGSSGCLHFQREQEDGIARNQGFYWGYELKLREQESRLGLLAVASGACMAVRRELFQPMSAAYGEDCILPLDVVSQNAVFVHVGEARAIDRMASSQAGELATRSRMTLRNWQGTWAYPHLLNPFKFPGYAFALWSHKILRWCSPLFLVSASLAAGILATHSPFYRLAAAGFAGFYLLALSGWWAQRRGLRWPLVFTAYSFLLANLGFSLGLWRALRGEQIRRYKDG